MTGPAGSRHKTLMDILDRVLDKGIVIDAAVRIALLGIDIVAVDAKVTVASFQTYLQLSEDPRAYELGLLAGEPPAARGAPHLSGSLGRELTEPAPALGGTGSTDPEVLGRAAYHEEPAEEPEP